jgi:uncharacterized membrane protein (UPF0127 family)
MTLMVMIDMIWNDGTRIRTDVADVHGLEPWNADDADGYDEYD